MSGFIAIEGVIGVGKTTLTHALAERLEAGIVLEAVEENPFLAQFYKDRAR
ncbi:MAG: deoxynucleoside kinase, partial [Candidatus Eisenbacteria bacterium]|nr:deoxynucleoside kinase [Candidatus Eisenbacteria bacterium]